MKEIIAAHGWPGRSLTGDDGAGAARRILPHSIGDSDFMRAGVRLLEVAVAAGEALRWQLAMLVDRVRSLERRLQIYGSQFDFDSNGILNPLPIEDPDHVNERRRELGLDALEERTKEMREQAAREGEQPPHDRDGHERRFHAWLRETGWRR